MDKLYLYAGLVVFTAVKVQVEIFFCVVTPCGVAVGHQRFGEPYCHHLQGEGFSQHSI
jgi:hypothetical protein